MLQDNVHISFANITAPCPHCGHLFRDDDERMLTACNTNKSGYTRRICKHCAARVGIAYNYMGNLVAFELNRKPDLTR